MSHITDAREEVQKVVGLLVGRFGSQEDVFGHLSNALAHLSEAAAAEEVPQVHPEQPVSMAPERETETTATYPATEAANATPEPEPMPAPKAHRTRRAKR